MSIGMKFRETPRQNHSTNGEKGYSRRSSSSAYRSVDISPEAASRDHRFSLTYLANGESPPYKLQGSRSGLG